MLLYQIQANARPFYIIIYSEVFFKNNFLFFIVNANTIVLYRQNDEISFVRCFNPNCGCAVRRFVLYCIAYQIVNNASQFATGESNSGYIYFAFYSCARLYNIVAQCKPNIIY